MTVTITATSPGSKLTQLAALQTEITALALVATTASSQQLLMQKQESLIRGCLDCGRLNAAQIFSQYASVLTAAWLLKFAPRIAILQASILSNPASAGPLANELVSEQIRAVDVAITQRLITGNSILNDLS